VGLEKAIALGERDWMARGHAQSLERRTFGSEETVTHWNERFANRPQIRIGGESLPPRLHSPNGGVLDGNHAGVDFAFVHGAHGAGECRNGYLFDRMPPYLRDRALGVGTPIALESNAHREIARLALTRRVRSRTVPVQTLRFQHDRPEVNVDEECCRSAGGL